MTLGVTPARVTLVSTYDLGHQPFGLASPAAWLRDAEVEVTTVDLSREPFHSEAFDRDLVAFHLPMHTATRLAVPVIRRLRNQLPDLAICCYGLDASLNESWLRTLGVRHVLGGEFEQALLDLATGADPVREGGSQVPRLAFKVPDRDGLPPLGGYATLRTASAGRVVAGYTEASRGCKHRCRHCPIVPVYDGRFRVVPVDVVLADIAIQVAGGARHITFGDPDFFNGVGHAMSLVEAFADRFPGVTYDATIKVEHLRQHGDRLETLRDTGCLFVVTAVESIDDAVLGRLEKGHTRADFVAVVERCREIGVTLAPTFIPFTPWTTLESYHDLLHTVEALDLVSHVAPIQLTLRLLVTAGSGLLELDPFSRPEVAGAFDAERLVHPWTHPDPRVDALQATAAALVGRRLTASRPEVFAELRGLSAEARGLPAPVTPVVSRAVVPYLNEPWYC